MNTWPTFAELGRAMWSNPQHLAALTVEYWSAQNTLWQESLMKWLGMRDRTEELELPHMLKADKRFAHKEWTENAVFDYLKHQYLLTAGWLQDTVGTVGEMDPADRKKAVFYTRAYVEAMNPANFFGLNPEVLEATVKERGENLVRGLRMMLEDLERGQGKLMPRHTDTAAFEVGRNTAVSEGAVIWQNELLQLIQYAPLTEQVHARPLLFVPPWINKFYILDLNPKKSMVKWLVEQGYTVFMISWVNPDARHGEETWESYMFKGAVAAIDKVLEETGQKSLNLVSYCIGGTLAGTLLAYFGKTGDTRVASCTFFTAQFDFEDAGELQIFVDDRTLEVLGDEMEQGFMPADRMAHAFNMLRANDLIWGYIVNNYMLGRAPVPLRSPVLELRRDGDARHRAPLLSRAVLREERLHPWPPERARRAGCPQRHPRACLPPGGEGGSHRPRGLGLSRRQGDEAVQGAFRALRFGPHRRCDQPARGAKIPVLDQPNPPSRRWRTGSNARPKPREAGGPTGTCG